MRALLYQPPGVLVRFGGAVGSHGQKLAVHIHMERAGINAREVGVEDVLVLVAVQIHRHELGSRPKLKEVASEAVQLADGESAKPDGSWHTSRERSMW